MEQEIGNRLLEAIKQECPQLKIRKFKKRDAFAIATIVFQAIAAIVTVADFAALLAVCKQFVKQNHRYHVKLRYRDAADSPQVIDLTSSNFASIESLIRDFAPEGAREVALEVRQAT